MTNSADGEASENRAARTPDPPPTQDDYDVEALVGRLKRNAALSMVVVALLVAGIWREPMAVVGALLGGALVFMNFLFMERLVARLLGTPNPAPNPLQMAFLALRVVLMALTLYGIFVLPGVRPIPVALGLSILVLAVVIESLSEVLSAPSPHA